MSARLLNALMLSALCAGCCLPARRHKVVIETQSAPAPAPAAPVALVAPAPETETPAYMETEPPAEPPAVMPDYMTPRPGKYHVWIDGHWAWRGASYVWIPGYWTLKTYQTAKWVKSHWEHRGIGWYWVPGHFE